MQKLLTITILAMISTACIDNGEFPRKGYFKAGKLFGCQSEQAARDLILEIKRGHVQEAQKQIDIKVMTGECRLFFKNELIILQQYHKGYYQFTPRGTDKNDYWASAELISNY